MLFTPDDNAVSARGICNGMQRRPGFEGGVKSDLPYRIWSGESSDLMHGLDPGCGDSKKFLEVQLLSLKICSSGEERYLSSRVNIEEYVARGLPVLRS